MLEIEIDGQKVTTPAGGTIMDAAAQVGIYIPHFCYHKKLSIAANCRMCLVQVEKAAKPLPACATPITDGMKVFTRSDYAIKAQKGVMEFLLINHPLDCPICDQGGECSLQDLAVGYGGVASRYQEVKRVVTEKYLGPLVATDMTRCIHCTRCVRFGQEIAGIMEMGQTGRGEHSQIMPYIDSTIDSELSGNIIDLCPVGALTSKPFRYTARTWELSRRRSVSPHDSLGSNLAVHVKNNRVMRILPLENESINECWLSDKDRFSYEGLNSPERLTQPMLKQGGVWQNVGWQTALEYVANGLKDIQRDHGADSVAALANPNQTLEELFLLQKLVRTLGSPHVDARPRQADFSRDGNRLGAPWLGMPVSELNTLDSVLLVGSRLRQDHPLMAHRLRVAVRHGAQFSVINPVDDDLLMKLAHKAIVPPQAMVNCLAQVLVAMAELSGRALPPDLAQGLGKVVPDALAQGIAKDFMHGERKAVLLGNLALHHEQYGDLHVLAQAIAELSGARLGVLGEAANSVGAYVAQAVPLKTGEPLAGFWSVPRKAYLLLGIEPENDCNNPALTLAALQQADMVVMMTAYKPANLDGVDVLLPIAPFSETAGTFVNTEGCVQSFNGTVAPLGETRPAWKILRVLGTLLGLTGFDYDDVESIRKVVLPEGKLAEGALNNVLSKLEVDDVSVGNALTRLGDVPMYRTDAMVRHAEVLQRTRTAVLEEVASVHPDLLKQWGLDSGTEVRVRQGEYSAVVKIMVNERMAMDCVHVPAALYPSTKLGAMMGEISVERV
ncbi:MAG: NADH-quinone oxidoreductase subunit NuoG [Betaproteobacteria bacterium]|nr:NADH-quinone oxidoreductase subunit NuoG [Betaproteobacteria bacterium]